MFSERHLHPALSHLPHQMMPISWALCLMQATKRHTSKNKEKTILWCKSQAHSAERDNFLFNKPLPPDCCTRRNISKQFNEKVGKQKMMSALGAQQPLFLSTSCLLSSVSASVSRSFGKHLLLSSLGEWGQSGEYQQQAYCHQTPYQAL